MACGTYDRNSCVLLRENESANDLSVPAMWEAENQKLKWATKTPVIKQGALSGVLGCKWPEEPKLYTVKLSTLNWTHFPDH